MDPLLQQAQLLLYRDDLKGALDLLDDAHARTGSAMYEEHAQRVRGWMDHLRSREAYAAAYEKYYFGLKGRRSLKHLERDIRVFFGRKTKKVVERTTRDPEFQMLEREVLAMQPARIFDAGSGEGRIALTLAARYPLATVEAIDVSPTNVRLSSRMSRYPNLTFHCGLIEDARRLLSRDPFDLAYSFAVLEHVRDVEEVVNAILGQLRRGGRFCFVVPMNEFEANGDLPEFEHEDGIAGHVRRFTEASLRERFGHFPNFVLEKIPGEPPAKTPPTLVPVEYGSYFVAVSKP
jgi:2-polyprenyl-3-methyl-5-hydroxy-6-metoxy-1,4-benzoquinol methylase